MIVNKERLNAFVVCGGGPRGIEGNARQNRCQKDWSLFRVSSPWDVLSSLGHGQSTSCLVLMIMFMVETDCEIDSDDDDDVYYYICERLKLEGETENKGVCTKERKGVTA